MKLTDYFFKVRECKPADKSRQHCFELYATGGAEIIKACKTDSDGKVKELEKKNYSKTFCVSHSR